MGGRFVEAIRNPNKLKAQFNQQPRVNSRPSVNPQDKAESTSANPKSTISSFCPSPFHLMLCFKCGMPVDLYVKNPVEAKKESRCMSSFHSMICFACGGDMSFCVYKPGAGNSSLAEIAGSSSQVKESPEGNRGSEC
ncbi:uncharacterized protein LOC118750231 [Rhagoletis pomonella]|uniref:uncharacterized protein LOC118750231 n=1 Tax=Rhagoletis pomonella TaxID=28610 RepID=UPI0017841964|nr:uncharacterized protein LOC118750231 [Rhagoletis pomonella]